MKPVPSYKGLTPASARASRAARGASKKRDTTPEVFLRRALWREGLRYRVAVGSLPGKPDVVFPRQRVVIFCDGEFWHGRNWRTRRAKLLRGTNAAYWIEKIERNVARDRATNAKLRRAGWRVLRFWESDVLRDTERIVKVIARDIQGQQL